MANLYDWIMEEAGSEVIEGIVIGDPPFCADDIPKLDIQFNKLLKWDDVKDLLHYKFDDSFGSEECHPITVWTTTKVMFIGYYDGSTWITTVPRNPCDDIPQFVGG